MRLVKAEISGFKRFSGSSAMDLDADVICIVGPNGAGKSSFLNALVRLNDDEPFGESDRTRVAGGGAQVASISAEFVLDPEDRAALASIPEASAATGIMITKQGNGERDFEVIPSPVRDHSRRTKVASMLKDLQKSRWLENASRQEADLEVTPDLRIEGLISDALEVAESTEEELDGAGALVSLRQRIDAETPDEGASGDNWLPKKYWSLPKNLQNLIEYELDGHPQTRAQRALINRVPEILKFEDEARNLKPTYDLTGEQPDLAITNLLKLAGTDWPEMVRLAGSGNKGHRKTALEAAESRLREKVSLAWDQTPLELGFVLDGSVLTVLMSMQADDYIEIDLHSDGLRQFVALTAFIALAEEQVPPIVLIDEADMHLHYDAQANLVSVLEEQEEASKVIYTTHSAGCLPRDLGVGVRGIVPIEVERDGEVVQTDHSKIINKFWKKDKGFTPLLIAMGASAFAFSAAKKALVTEGFTDALLLPSLIREATGADRLPYQVVPEFATAGAAAIPDFDLIAARVAFLADGDKGGEDNLEHLAKNAVLEGQTLYLGGSKASGYSLEDLIDENVYLAALNLELDRQKPGLEFPKRNLRKRNRSGGVKDWCASQHDESGEPLSLGKGAVAQRVLDLRKKFDRLVAPDHKKTLIELDREVRAIFERATVEIAREEELARLAAAAARTPRPSS